MQSHPLAKGALQLGEYGARSPAQSLQQCWQGAAAIVRRRRQLRRLLRLNARQHHEGTVVVPPSLSARNTPVKQNAGSRSASWYAGLVDALFSADGTLL